MTPYQETCDEGTGETYTCTAYRHMTENEIEPIIKKVLDENKSIKYLNFDSFIVTDTAIAIVNILNKLGIKLDKIHFNDLLIGIGEITSERVNSINQQLISILPAETRYSFYGRSVLGHSEDQHTGRIENIKELIDKVNAGEFDLSHRYSQYVKQ